MNRRNPVCLPVVVPAARSRDAASDFKLAQDDWKVGRCGKAILMLAQNNKVEWHRNALAEAQQDGCTEHLKHSLRDECFKDTPTTAGEVPAERRPSGAATADVLRPFA